ncbi:hypothetical protein V3C99_003983 [Haemonchus contortus]
MNLLIALIRDAFQKGDKKKPDQEKDHTYPTPKTDQARSKEEGSAEGNVMDRKKAKKSSSKESQIKSRGKSEVYSRESVSNLKIARTQTDTDDISSFGSPLVTRRARSVPKSKERDGVTGSMKSFFEFRHIRKARSPSRTLEECRTVWSLDGTSDMKELSGSSEEQKKGLETQETQQTTISDDTTITPSRIKKRTAR